jgi:hypothetical protein
MLPFGTLGDRHQLSHFPFWDTLGQVPFVPFSHPYFSFLPHQNGTPGDRYQLSHFPWSSFCNLLGGVAYASPEPPLHRRSRFRPPRERIVRRGVVRGAARKVRLWRQGGVRGAARKVRLWRQGGVRGAARKMRLWRQGGVRGTAPVVVQILHAWPLLYHILYRTSPLKASANSSG